MNESRSDPRQIRLSEPPFKRLHAATLWVPVMSGLQGIAILVILAAFPLGIGTSLFLGLWVFIPGFVAYQAARFLSFRYCIRDQELVVHSGILWRSQRQIPLRKVQDIEWQQGLIYRLVDVAKVTVKTAGSEVEEVVLDAVATSEAESLRAAVAAAQRAHVEDGAVAETPGKDAPETLLTLTARELLLGGLTSRMAATIGALIGTALYFGFFMVAGSAIGEAVEGPLERWSDFPLPWTGTFLEPAIAFWWDDALGKSVLVILGGLLFFIGSFFFRHSHFQLTRAGSVLTRTQGLWKTRSESLSLDRVQALKIEEALLRRWFGLASVWIDTAGDQRAVEDEKKRDALAPVVGRRRAEELVREILPGLAAEAPGWKRISRHAILRRAKKGWLIVLALTVQVCLVVGWAGLSLLSAVPLVYYLSWQWYRNTVYRVEAGHLISRKGWFNRSTQYLPIVNIQNLMLSQTYFDRRRDLATLEVDTAGQSNTGGGVTIRHLPIQAAREIYHQLGQQVARTSLRW